MIKIIIPKFNEGNKNKFISIFGGVQIYEIEKNFIPKTMKEASIIIIGMLENSDA